jgi:hypothetical protein
MTTTTDLLSTHAEFQSWVDDLTGYGGGRRSANLFLCDAGYYSAECGCEDQDELPRISEVCLRLDLKAGRVVLADADLELACPVPSQRWFKAEEREIADTGIFVCSDSRGKLWLAETL